MNVYKVAKKRYKLSSDSVVEANIPAMLVYGRNEVERVVIGINGKVIDIDMIENKATVEDTHGGQYRFCHVGVKRLDK